ncbi:MAG: LacI family DNA-binding transcriptional regulator [Firmicutes bacterium]|nr:LacI family DNA-binding transcriptional regulator [Bacillota bacterium]
MNIKQIAKAAGVSVATVSRVLNHPESVAPKTREKIQKIIDEEEYTPNWFAQGLNFKKTRTIGLILPQNINSANMEVANAVEEVARQKGYITLICNIEKDPRREKEYIDQLMTRKVDGLILLYSTLNEEYASWIEEENVPAVLIGETRARDNWDSVFVDCRAGAAEMTAHLIECGHRRIAMLCGKDPEPEAKAMLQGYKNVLKASGIKVDETLIYQVNNNIEGGYIGMKKMIGRLPKKPDAVFASSDEIAFGAMDALKEMKLRVPEDIAVAGFGNDRMSSLMEPKVTTVELPYRKMGIYGARMLFDQIEEKEAKKEPKAGKRRRARKIQLQTKMRVRKSCGHRERIGEMF